MIRKLSILLNALYGEFLKVWYCLGFVHVPYGITKNTRPVGERVVISLTSYGMTLTPALLRHHLQLKRLLLRLERSNRSTLNYMRPKDIAEH